MKIRIITGVALGLFVISLLVFMQYPLVLGLPLAVFSGMAAYEIMHVTKCKNKVITALTVAFAVAMPLYIDLDLGRFIKVPVSVILTVYLITLMVLMLKNYETVKFENIAMAIYASVCVPYAISCAILVRDLFKTSPDHIHQAQALFLVLWAMYCAWLSDTFAYFFGRKLGKHKLSPKISPKKSVEGAVAGVLGTMLISVITYFICSHFYFYKDTIRLWMVIVGTVVLSVISVLGDLSASVIKRNFNEKDFGTLFPGHGGVMDRIDSFIFVMPSMYALVKIMLAFA